MARGAGRNRLSLLTGEYRVRIDHGRFAVPSRLQGQMADDWPFEVGLLPWSDCLFLVRGSPNPLQSAVIAVDPDFPANIDPLLVPEARQLVRAVASKLEVDVMDKRGRVRASQSALLSVGIDGPDAMLIGAARHLELWAPGRWAEATAVPSPTGEDLAGLEKPGSAS